jgi:hypothetical protein
VEGSGGAHAGGLVGSEALARLRRSSGLNGGGDSGALGRGAQAGCGRSWARGAGLGRKEEKESGGRKRTFSNFQKPLKQMN